MADHDSELREAIINALKADDDVAAIVGSRVYGTQPPAKPDWPFVRYGFPIVTPFKAQGWRGAVYELTINAFCKGGAGAEAAVDALARAIVFALDEIDVPISGAGGVVMLQWTRKQVIRDTDEAGAYHGIVQFDAATAEIVA